MPGNHWFAGAARNPGKELQWLAEALGDVLWSVPQWPLRRWRRLP